MRRHSKWFLIVGLIAQSAFAQGMDLLGVAATTTTTPEPTFEERQALQSQLLGARDELKRARERLASLESSLPDYAPGGFWERHYQKEVADRERSLPFAQADVAKSRSAWSRFKRLMNTDILSGEVVGSRDDWAADSRMRMTRDRLAQARGALARVPADYASMTRSRDEVRAQIPKLAAELAPLEAQRAALNARGIRVMWDDLP